MTVKQALFYISKKNQVAYINLYVSCWEAPHFKLIPNAKIDSKLKKYLDYKVDIIKPETNYDDTITYYCEIQKGV